jgi:hypothetical protein
MRLMLRALGYFGGSGGGLTGLLTNLYFSLATPWLRVPPYSSQTVIADSLLSASMLASRERSQILSARMRRPLRENVHPERMQLS